MGIGELLLLAVGLSMDAFAVSVCKGLAMKKATIRAQVTCGAWFGGFQGLMPLIGFLLGTMFADAIQSIDHWIAFVLLGLIGANMLKESFGDAEECDCSFCPKAMLPMAVATSIDALAVGVTFALLPDVNITAAVSFIGIITFTLSAVGVYIGHLFGARFKSKAELTGGIVLILMGCKILLEHLGVLDWFFGLFA